MANRQIKVGINFDINRTGLDELTRTLNTVKTELANGAVINIDTDKAINDVTKLQHLLNTSWNSKLNQLDLSKLHREIKNTYGDVKGLKEQLSNMGPAGVQAFNQIANSVLTTNIQLKQSSKMLDEFAKSMANTVRWGFSSAIFNTVTGAISKAYNYTKKLDSSLNDIRIVTGKSAENMEKFAKQANAAAKGLGASTLDYTEASLIYYQQGLGEADVKARTETTLKAANVTGQYAEEVSEQLTAVWNGYKVSAQEAELYIDKLAAVASTTAADLEELSTGMSKVASAANTMGVDVDQLNAQLATIVSVTRQAPESVGTALKTIYARMSDLKIGKSDEDGLGLGDVSGTMAAMGIQIMNSNGDLRDMGEIIEEVAAKWDTWTDAQKTAMAQVMAGKRQYNNLVALFDNWDMYTDALNESANAAGTLQRQQDIYMESTEAHLQKLSTEAEKTYDILFDQNLINGFADALTGVLSLFNSFTESLGGGARAFTSFGLIGANILHKQIANGLTKTYKENLKNKKIEEDLKKQFTEEVAADEQFQDLDQNSQAFKNLIDNRIRVNNIADMLSTEESNEITQLTKEIAEAQQEYEQLIAYRGTLKDKYNLDLDQNIAGKTDKERVEDLLNKKQENQEKKQEEANVKLLQKLAEQKKTGSKEKIEILKKLDIIDKDFQKDTLKITEEIQNKIKEYIENFKTENEQLDKEIQELQEIIEDIDAEEDDAGKTISKLNTAKQNFENALSDFEFDEVVDELIQAMSALGTVGMSAWGAWDVLNDELLTTDEKLKQLGTSAVTIGTTLFSNWDQIMALPKNLTKGLDAISKGLSTFKKEGSDFSAETSENFGGALKQVWQAVKALPGPFKVAAVAVAGLTAAFAIGMKIYNAKRDKMLEEQELLKEAQENYQKTKEEYNKLISALEDYRGAKNALSELKEGTIEWTTAVQELNQQVLTLMDTYPELAKYVTSKDGVLSFTDEGLENIQQIYAKQTDAALQRQYDQGVNTVEAEMGYETQAAARRIGKIDYTFETTQSQVGYGNKQDPLNMNYAAAKTIETSSGTLSVAQVDSLLNAALEKNVNLTTDSAESIAKTLKGWSGFNEEKIQSMIENLQKNHLVELGNIQAIYESKNAELDIYKEQKDLSTMKNSGYFDGVDNNTLTAIWNKNRTEIEQQDVSDYMNQIRTAEQYGKEGNLLGDSFKIEGYGKNQKIVGYNKEGEKVSEQLLSAVKNSIKANQQVIQYFKTQGRAEEEIKAVQKIKTDADNISKGFGNYISTFAGGKAGSFAGLTGAEARKMQADFSGKTKENFINKYKDQLGFGADTGKDLAKEIDAAWEEYWENYNGIDLAKTMINTANVTAEVQRALAAGDELTDSQLAHLNQLEAKYTELAAIKDRSSHEYLELLRQITEQEENNAREELRIQRENDEAAAESLLEQMKAKQALLDGDGIFSEETKQQFEMEIIALDEQFNETMDRLRENNKELEIAIKADIETDIQEGFGIVDEFKKLQDVIPDDLKLTVDEAEKIMADGYGAILNDSEALGDNQIKINKQVLNDYVDTKQAELEASRQAKIAELDMQIASFETQHQLLTQQAEAYRKAAEAKDADSYAKAMAEATRLNQQYQAEVHLLDQKLQREEEFTTGKEETYSQYYKDLTGMYEKDSQNEQEAENAAAKNEAESTKNRIENANKLYEAYLAVGDARQYAQGATTYRPNYTVDSETYWKADTEAVNTEPQQGATKNEASTGVNTQSLEEFFKQLYEENKATAIDEAKASADYSEKKAEEAFTTKGKLEGMKSILESAGLSLDTAQSKAGTKDGKDKKEEKRKEDEIDRYWELNTAIENVEESLSDLDKQQEKLYGKEKIKSLKEENKLLAEQADAYRALAAEQRLEAGELQGMLSAYGVMFDAQGGIANHMQASMAMLEQYNAAVAAYNAGLMTEVAFTAQEKAYENFKSMLERYETLYYQEMRETQNKLDDIHRQELENNLEAWEIEIQLKLDMKELKRQWNDFFKEINENLKLVYEDLGATMNNLVKNSKTYVGKDGDIATIRKAISDVTKEIDKMRSGGSSDMFESISQAQEKLKELNEQLMDSATALRDLWQEAWETYLEGIDQAAEKFDELMDRYDAINEQIEYQRELIELLYGDEAYDLMSEYYEAQLENTGAQLNSLRQQAEMWKKQYEAAKAIDDANGTLSEDTKKFYEEWQEAQQGVNDKVKEYIKLLQDDYKNTVDKILDDLEKKLTGGHGLSEVREQWELLQKQAEGYYDDVERVYQLSTLENKYEKAISNATGANQKKLQAMYEKEMKYLKEKKKLSEYDIEIANAKYDMTLKQIALEEAQQNKNAMKLVRGADGNWNYQYVANEDDIAQKEQDLLDSTDNYYQVSKDGANDYYEKWISSLEDYFSKRAAIEDKYKNDEVGKANALAELEERYNGEDGILTNLAADAENIKINLADATLQSTLNNYKVNLDSYEYMTVQQQELLKALENGTITSYDEMLNKATSISQNTLTVWQSMAAGIADLWYKNPDSIKQEILLSYDKIQEANEDYQQAISDLEKSAGQDFGEDGIKGAIDDAKKATNELEDETKKLVQTAERELPKYREQVNKIEQAWYGVKGGIESSISSIQTYLNYVGDVSTKINKELIPAIDTMIKKQQEFNEELSRQPQSPSGNGDGSNTVYVTTGTGSNGETFYSVYKLNNDGTLGAMISDASKRYTLADIRRLFSNAKKYDKDVWGYRNTPDPYRNGEKVTGGTITLATGGYTGEWNNGDADGRLAWLHQKELVLNSADTANILSVVDTVRDLTKIGSSIESNIMNNIGKTLFNLMNLGNYNQLYQPQLATDGPTENVFNINAEFPNANDVSSIREAILSLPNLASQYIARNKK